MINTFIDAMIKADEEFIEMVNKGKRKQQRRSGGDRRIFAYSTALPERRVGRERRLFDRRNLLKERFR